MDFEALILRHRCEFYLPLVECHLEVVVEEEEIVVEVAVEAVEGVDSVVEIEDFSREIWALLIKLSVGF